jgi:DNA polymerase III subunit delta
MADAVVHAFEFLESGKLKTIPSCVAVAGSEGFLRQRSTKRLIELSGVDFDATKKFDGEEALWRDVHDELATLSLFDAGHHRIAIVTNADDFVSKNRPALERWLGHAPADALLVLEVSSFPKTTRLYKSVAASGLVIDCNAPDDKKTMKWLVSWAKSNHGFELTTTQASFMLDRVGNQVGLLDCELSKIALFADKDGRVSLDHLQELVGGWRTHTAFQIAEEIASGNIGPAIEHLDRLFTSGEHALALMGAISWSLRRFGVAATLIAQAERAGQRLNGYGAMLEKAGFRRFELEKAEGQLKRMGKSRAMRLQKWLGELELELKGSHSQEAKARFAVEAFIMRFVNFNEPIAAKV